jgi:predicted RNA-binding protein with RPS1 domain
MKQCKANPWEEFAGTVNRGDKVSGPVKSITDFGVFVGLAAGIDGLVHLSDLSWHEPGEAAVRNYKKGQDVEAIVLAVDVERERISLGIKQLDTDPFTSFTTMNDRGALVTGKVKTVDPRGAEIQLNDDVTGYLRASEISRDRVEDARNVLKEGDEVSAMIINVDRQHHRLDFLGLLEVLHRLFAGVRPGQVGQVHQAVDAAGQADEHAEVGDRLDLAFHLVALLVLAREVFPRVGHALLHAQGDAAAVLVDLQDHDLDFVAHLHHA